VLEDFPETSALPLLQLLAVVLDEHQVPQLLGFSPVPTAEVSGWRRRGVRGDGGRGITRGRGRLGMGLRGSGRPGRGGHGNNNIGDQ
jgi:hypothetical protein